MKILVWAEPHPIRNSWVEFLAHTQFTFDALTSAGIEARYFANSQCADALVRTRPEIASLLSWPTGEEDSAMSSWFGRWDIAAESVWTDLVSGRGDCSVFYEGVLDRLYDDEAFDAILNWSDNGALRRFAARRNLPVLSCELGPTRVPFGPTFYVDLCGTNGFAAVRDFPLDLISEENLVPGEAWIALADIANSAREGVIEQSVTGLGKLPSRPFVFVPLQLADDQNTLVHSPVGTPVEFVAAIIPRILHAGFDVVIKGHPHAPLRPRNLKEEVAALERAKEFGEGVHFIEPGSPWQETVRAISQAEAVCTINSSVGFEAALMGKKSILFGDAAYDIGGVLKSDIEDLEVRLKEGAPQIDRSITALCRHYLHPYDVKTAGSVLRSALPLAAEYGAKRPDRDFWARWMRLFDHGQLAATGFSRASNPKALPEPPEWWTGRAHRASVEDVQGHIDSLVINADRSIDISGWVLVRGSEKASEIILVDDAGVVLAIASSGGRPDVAKHFNITEESSGFFFREQRLPRGVNLADLQVVVLTRDGLIAELKDARGRALSRGGLATTSARKMPFWQKHIRKSGSRSAARP